MMKTSMKILNDEVKGYRKPENRVDSLFLNRWSPRAMSGEQIARDELTTLFEAARWAPSAFNLQPWRFIYALRDTPHWNTFFSLLTEGNRLWAAKAAALIVIISKRTSEYKGNSAPNPTHSFDTGSACENLALQGSLNGLVVHAMAGFDHEKAKTELDIPDDYQVEAIVAIGKKGSKQYLP
jgi:nitroreductase